MLRLVSFPEFAILDVIYQQTSLYANPTGSTDRETRERERKVFLEVYYTK